MLAKASIYINVHYSGCRYFHLFFVFSCCSFGGGGALLVLTHALNGKCLVYGASRRKCLCVSGKVVLWLTYFYVRILVPMSYLKLWNYIYRPSVPSCPSRRRRRRRRPLSVRPSRRPSRRRRPSSVRPSRRPSRRRRRRPLSVRPSVPSSVPSSSSVLCPSVPSSVQSLSFHAVASHRACQYNNRHSRTT